MPDEAIAQYAPGMGLRIGIELIAAGTAIEEGSGGGHGYVHAVIPRLRDDPRIEHVRLYVPEWYEAASEWRHPKVTLVRCRVSRKRPLRVAYEQLALPILLRRDGLDALLSPANYRPLAYRDPSVVVLHAIQYFLLDDDIGRLRSAYLRFAVPRSVRGADVAVAVSETLRRDAIELFGLDPDRIVAVPLGPQPWVTSMLDGQVGGAIEPHRLPGDAPYVLCLSRLYGLKNHARLIRAYARMLREHDLPHRLLVAGGEADVTYRDLEAIAAAAGVGDRVVLMGQVPSSQLGPLYLGASAVAYVSLYETFGHPVLEAFAAGVPVLTSNRGGTAEVGGPAARLVDPESEAEIASGLADVLGDDELRRRLVAAGRDRLREFSWADCARGTVDALVEAVRRSRGSGARRPAAPDSPDTSSGARSR
jgi:glycosyltransferase involved in cell wall biosynthesis